MTRKTVQLSALAFGILLTGLLIQGRTQDEQPQAESTSVAKSSSPSGRVTPVGSDPADERMDEIVSVKDGLERWRSLHAPVGYLSQEETEALMMQRKAAAEALAACIGDLDADELPEIAARFSEASRTRDKLLLIDGLGRNAAPQAAEMLGQLYTDADGYTLQSRILRALGDSPAPGHAHLLIEQMERARDERLQQLAAQALYGEVEALDALSAMTMAGDERPIKVRLEALHSLSAIDTPEARAAVAELATDEDVLPRLRLYARRAQERMSDI